MGSINTGQQILPKFKIVHIIQPSMLIIIQIFHLLSSHIMHHHSLLKIIIMLHPNIIKFLHKILLKINIPRVPPNHVVAMDSQHQIQKIKTVTLLICKVIHLVTLIIGVTTAIMQLKKRLTVLNG